MIIWYMMTWLHYLSIAIQGWAMGGARFARFASTIPDIAHANMQIANTSYLPPLVAKLWTTVPTSRVADPHHFDPDPDPACHFDADADPDPIFHFDANPVSRSGS